MSTPNYIQNEQAGIWSRFAPFLTDPIAAGIAIIPTYYGFVKKSCKQIDKPMPTKTMQQWLFSSVKSSPTVSVIVGTQLIAQNLIEKAIVKLSGKNEKNNFASMIFSAIMVGFVSSIPLAVFNGQTLDRTPMQSLKFLNCKQITAIVARETSFLFSLRISEPVSNAMKEICGDSKATEYGSCFASGAIGSLIGHPADTAFTLWQKEIEVKSLSQLMRGSSTKAVTVGCFAVCYNIAKKTLESRS